MYEIIINDRAITKSDIDCTHSEQYQQYLSVCSLLIMKENTSAFNWDNCFHCVLAFLYFDSCLVCKLHTQCYFNTTLIMKFKSLFNNRGLIRRIDERHIERHSNETKDRAATDFPSDSMAFRLKRFALFKWTTFVDFNSRDLCDSYWRLGSLS